MGAGVAGALVIADGGDLATGGGREPDAQIDGVGIGAGEHCRGIGGGKQRAGGQGRHHLQADHGRAGAAAPIGDGIAKGGSADIADGGGEGDGLGLGVEGDGAARGRARADQRQRIVIGVGVIGQKRCGGDGDRAIALHHEAGVVDAIGRIIGGGDPAIDHVHPVIIGVVGGGEAVLAGIGEGAAGGGQRAADMGGGKVIGGDGIAIIAEIAGHIGDAGGDRHRGVEQHGLPAAGGFVGEAGRGQKRAAGGPQRADMGAGIAQALVVAHPDNGARLGGGEAHADGQGGEIAVIGHGGQVGGRKQRARTALVDHHGHAGAGGFEINAVIDGARADVVAAADQRGPAIGPVVEAGGAVPGAAAIGGHLHHRDPATAGIGGGAGDGIGLGGSEGAAGAGNGAGGGQGIGALAGHRQALHQGGRLHAHFGEQIDHGLLHVGIGGGGLEVMVAVEPPGPVDGTRTEDEGAAGGAIKGERMGRGARAHGAAIIEQQRVDVEGGRGQRHQPRRAEAVVEIGIPFIAEQVLGQGIDLAGLQIGDAGIAPEAELGHVIGHGDGIEPVAVDGKDGAGQRVFRAAGAQHRIAPGGSGAVDVGIVVVPALLVGHERLVGGAGAIDAGFPAGLPIDLVAAPERQVDPGIAGRLDIGALVGGPVFVMAHRQEDLGIEQLGAIGGGVDAGDVIDVVAVLLEEADGGMLGAEDEILRAGGKAAIAGDDGPVIADGAGTAGAAGGIDAAVEIVATPPVIGLPGGVGGLEGDVAGGLVVAHDEGHHVFAAGAVKPGHLGVIDARDRIGRNIPGGRDRPVAGIDQLGGGVEQGQRLRLGAGELAIDGLDQPGAVAAVIAQPIDIDAVIGGIGVDLEIDALAVVERELGGIALDRGVAAPDHPDAFGGALLLVFEHDGIGQIGGRQQRDFAHIGARGRGVGRRRNGFGQGLGGIVEHQRARGIAGGLATTRRGAAGADRAHGAGAPGAGPAGAVGRRPDPGIAPVGQHVVGGDILGGRLDDRGLAQGLELGDRCSGQVGRGGGSDGRRGGGQAGRGPRGQQGFRRRGHCRGHGEGCGGRRCHRGDRHEGGDVKGHDLVQHRGHGNGIGIGGQQARLGERPVAGIDLHQGGVRGGARIGNAPLGGGQPLAALVIAAIAR